MLEAPKIIANVGLLILETVWAVGVAVYRFPIRTGLLAVFVMACVLSSFRTVTAVLMYGMLALVVWNLAGRALEKLTRDQRVTAAYQWLVGRRLYNAWRRWRLYERRWQRTLEGQHLTYPLPQAYDDVPKLSKVACTRAGDTVRVKVLPGQTTQNYIGMDGQVSRNLAKAFKARECRVSDIPQTDYINLELPRGDDPLAETVPFPGIPQSVDEVDLRRIPIGVDERGRPVTVPVWGSHVLVVGQTGAGKGSVFWGIILALIPYIREGSVELWAADPKGAIELNPGRNLFARFEYDPERIQVMLAQAVTRMQDNMAYIKDRGERKLTPTPERPLTVVIIDELGVLSADKKVGESIRQLVNVGRAPGVSTIGAVQNAVKEVVRDRDEIPVKVALRIENQDTVRKILGRTAYLAGARAEEIPRSLPGVGFCKVDETADDLEASTVPRWLRWLPWVSPATVSVAMAPRRFRAYWISDDLIAEANESFAPEPDEVVSA